MLNKIKEEKCIYIYIYIHTYIYIHIYIQDDINREECRSKEKNWITNQWRTRHDDQQKLHHVEKHHPCVQLISR